MFITVFCAGIGALLGAVFSALSSRYLALPQYLGPNVSRPLPCRALALMCRTACYCAVFAACFNPFQPVTPGFSFPASHDFFEVCVSFLSFFPLLVLTPALVSTDFACHLLPNRLLLVGGVSQIFGVGVLALIAGRPSLVFSPLAGAFAYFCFLLLLSFLPSGLGAGDVKLAALLGFALGSLGFSHLFFAVLTAWILGGLWALMCLVTKRAGFKTQVAMGPWLLAGTLLSLTL